LIDFFRRGEVAGDVRLLVVTAPAPDGDVPGWDGFVGSFERNSELRGTPPQGQEVRSP